MLIWTNTLFMSVLVLLISQAQSATYSDYSRLYTNITTGYSTVIRPVINQSEPLTVYVKFELSQIIGVDELAQTVNLNVWINFTWQDEVRTWTPADYGNVDIVYPKPSDIWLPAPLLLNSVGDGDVFGNKRAATSITSDGVTAWLPGSLLSFSCSLDLTYFPFDKQRCRMEFLFNTLEKELNFVETQSTYYQSKFVSNGEWDLERVMFEKDILKYPNAFASFSFDVVLKRRPEYFIINVILPIQAISLLSCFVFVLPVDSGERAGFSTALLLSIVVFMGNIGSQSADKSDPMPLVIIYVFCMSILSITSVIATAVQLHVVRKNSSFTEHRESEEDQDKLKEKTGQGLKTKPNANIVLFTGYFSVWCLINIYFLIHFLTGTKHNTEIY